MRRLLVDTREPSHVIQAIKHGNPLIPVERTILTAGDIWMLGQQLFIIIERKTVADLLASIKDGRLENQVAEALILTSSVVVLIEGEWITTNDGHISYEVPGPFPSQQITGWKATSVWGMLSKVQRMGAIVRMYQSDLMIELQNIYRFFEKSPLIKPRTGADIQCPESAFLACLPGIGAGRAEALWNRYQNLAACLAYLTNPDDLAWPDVPGIGTKTRENIRDFIGAMLLPVSNYKENENDEND